MNSTRRVYGSRRTNNLSTTPYDTRTAPFLSPIGINTDVVVEQTSCNPWTSLIYCPIYLYIIVALIGFYLTWQSLASNKTAPAPGEGKKSKTPQSSAMAIGLTIYAIISLIFGMIIYNQCKRCDRANAWLWFIIALLAPFLFVALTLGILSFVFGFAVGWAGTKDVKKGKKGVNNKSGK